MIMAHMLTFIIMQEMWKPERYLVLSRGQKAGFVCYGETTSQRSLATK